MSLLPKKQTDIFDLVRNGYQVTYSESDGVWCDDIEGMVDLHDAVKETITRNGIIDSPDDQPSLKYFDKKTGEIFAALWIKNGILKREHEDSPAAICERSTATGAAGHGTHYIMRSYYVNGKLSAFISDQLNDSGQMIRTAEDYYYPDGKMRWYVRRDLDSGKILPQYSSSDHGKVSLPKLQS
jgi:hypothetical protein